MAITYPLSLPTTVGIANIEFRAINSVATSTSPFTFSSQVHAYSGQAWQVDVTLPPMSRDLAEVWVAFLISLRGQFGTFYLGDPNATEARGSARDSTTIELSKPAVVGSDNLVIEEKPLKNNENNYLRAGDYMHVANGDSRQLFKVLKDVNTKSNGTAEVDIWPAIRKKINKGTPIVVKNPQGIFRLSSNEQSYSINDASLYGISFGAVEVITV